MAAFGDIFGLEGEDWCKDILENARDLIHIVDPSGRILYVNKIWSQALEYDLGEIQGRSIYSFLLPEEERDFRAYREKLLKGEATDKEVTISFVRKSGALLKAEGFVSVTRQNDTPLYTRGIFRDITARLESEERISDAYRILAEKQKSLHEVLLNAPDAVIVIDKESLIAFWNTKAEQIFGWEAVEVIGTPLADAIIPTQYKEAHVEGMKRFLRTDEVRVLNKTIEITALNKAREEFYISLTISQTQWRGDVAFIAFVRDITTQKREQLELEQKKRELEISNQNLERFAHVASHDMREPVRKIKVFSSLLHAKYGAGMQEEAKQYVEKIERSCDRLLTMVTGVLNYSSISNNKEQVELISLNEVINSIKHDLELAIKESGATIICKSDISFEGAPFLIYQLFYNLITNALKFHTADKPLVVTVLAAPAPKDSLPEALKKEPFEYVFISVCDNGIGFAQSDANMIFDAFTRLNSKDQFEGTGLGLALCRDVAERHKGHISARGEEGAGACFDIFLPVTRG